MCSGSHTEPPCFTEGAGPGRTRMREKADKQTQPSSIPQWLLTLCYLFSPPYWCLKFTVTQSHLDMNVNGRKSPVFRHEKLNFSCSPHLEYKNQWRCGRGQVCSEWSFLYSLKRKWLLGLLYPPNQVWSTGVLLYHPLQCALEKSTIINSKKSPNFSDV